MTRTESSPIVSIPPRTVLAYRGRAADPAVVCLRGENDVSTAGWLWETLARTMNRGDADLVVDLSRVAFMDAATIGVIIRADNHLRERSRSLVLRCPSSPAHRILELCGLAALVEGDPPQMSLTLTAGALGAGVRTSVANRVESVGCRPVAKLPPPGTDLRPATNGTSAAPRRGR